MWQTIFLVVTTRCEETTKRTRQRKGSFESQIRISGCLEGIWLCKNSLRKFSLYFKHELKSRVWLKNTLISVHGFDNVRCCSLTTNFGRRRQTNLFFVNFCSSRFFLRDSSFLLDFLSTSFVYWTFSSRKYVYTKPPLRVFVSTTFSNFRLSQLILRVSSFVLASSSSRPPHHVLSRSTNLVTVRKTSLQFVRGRTFSRHERFSRSATVSRTVESNLWRRYEEGKEFEKNSNLLPD